jgi:hypothetical protein
VAVGSSGAVRRSDDGVSWTAVDLGTSGFLESVSVIPGPNGERLFLISGCYLSSDAQATSWVPVDCPVGAYAKDVVSLGDRLVAIGTSGIAFRDCPVPAPGLLAPFCPEESMLPACASTPDSGWVSDLIVSTTGDAPIEVVAGFLERSRGGTDPRWRQWLLSPDQCTALVDVVGATFGEAPAAGSVLLRSSARLLGWSRIRRGDLGGEIPLFRSEDAIGDREFVVLLPNRPLSAARTPAHANLGAASWATTPTTVRYELFDGKGRSLRAFSLDLPSFVSGLAQDVGGDFSNGYAVVSSATVGARFLPFGSINDDAAGDTRFLRPLRPSSAPLVVPVVAHAGGVGGVLWQSDLAIVAIDGTSAGEIRFHRAVRPGWTTTSAIPFAISAGNALRIEDVVRRFVEGEGAVGWLEIVQTEGRIVATSETYVVSSVGPILGQVISGRAFDSAASPGERLRITGLRHEPELGDTARANLGVVNVGGVPLDFEVWLFAAPGCLIGHTGMQLEPGELRQEDLFRSLGAGSVASGWAEIEASGPGGAFVAYASMISPSGDPVFIDADLVDAGR